MYFTSIYKFDIEKKMPHKFYFSDRRVRERTLEKLWRKNSGAMESFIMALEVNNIFN